MRQSVFIVIVCLAFFAKSNAQITFSTSDTVRGVADYFNQGYLTIQLTNSSPTVQVFTWRKSDASIVPGIECDGICDGNGCYSCDGTSHSIALAPSEMSYIKVGFQISPPPYSSGSSFITLTSSAGLIHFKMSNPVATSILRISEIASIQVFPNPVKDILYIHSDKLLVNGNICIADATGRVLSTYPITDKLRIINVSDWPEGVYFMSAVNSAGSILYSQRLMKR